jgi:hypothetical protein
MYPAVRQLVSVRFRRMATNVVRTLLNSDGSREREETWPELSDRLTSAAIYAEAAPVVAMPAVSAVKVIAACERWDHDLAYTPAMIRTAGRRSSAARAVRAKGPLRGPQPGDLRTLRRCGSGTLSFVADSP